MFYMSQNSDFTHLLSMTDETLLAHMKNGDENALAVLISRYVGLVKTIAGRYNINAYEQDDIIQEGLIGLLHAIECFDPDSGCSFNTFANICIKHRILQALQYTKTNKFKSLDRAVSIDELTEKKALQDFSATPEEILIAREKLDAVKTGVDTLLSDLEREVLFLYLGGADYKQISAKLGITAKAVDNALQRVRRKLKTV